MVAAPYIKEVAVYLAKGGIRNPKKHDWENILKISAHPQRLDAKTMGEAVMLAQDMFKDGITDKFLAEMSKGNKPAEEFVDDTTNEAEEERKDKKKGGKPAPKRQNNKKRAYAEE